MRALSKYCTVRLPPGAPANGSWRISPGCGPHNQERATALCATGASLRVQTPANCALAKARVAAAWVAAGWSSAAASGKNRARARNRVSDRRGSMGKRFLGHQQQVAPSTTGQLLAYFPTIAKQCQQYGRVPRLLKGRATRTKPACPDWVHQR